VKLTLVHHVSLPLGRPRRVLLGLTVMPLALLQAVIVGLLGTD
jgi:hypothetical protein